MESRIRVCVADDHNLVRKLMVQQISQFGRCHANVLEAGDGTELLALFRNHPVDVLLLDINMPKMDGQEAATILLKKYPDLKIVVLTMNDSLGKVITFLEMGVHGYLLKDCSIEDVQKAIYDVVDLDFHQNALSTRAMKLIVKRPSQKEDLTVREIEIVKLICEELTMVEIGKRLSISTRTAENHRLHILRKVGAKNTVGIVRYAYERGFISLKGA